MFRWRNALILGGFFIVAGLIYWVGWYYNDPSATDYTGFTLLVALGVAMAFGFAVLLRVSREL